MVPDEEELTPLEEEMPLEVEELPLEVEELDDVCEEDELEVLEAESEVLVLVDVADVEPGIVAALTALNRPTPATAANAAA